jgi:hypothetical protein
MSMRRKGTARKAERNGGLEASGRAEACGGVAWGGRVQGGRKEGVKMAFAMSVTRSPRSPRSPRVRRVRHASEEGKKTSRLGGGGGKKNVGCGRGETRSVFQEGAQRREHSIDSVSRALVAC